MNCPACGEFDSSRVTRTMKGQYTSRQRQCPCGAEWVTQETVIKHSIKTMGGVARLPIPVDVIEAVMKRDGRRCRYCGTADVKLGIDHVTPLCAPIPLGVPREEETARRNSIDNLVACCPGCNLSKGDRVNGKRQGARYMPALAASNGSAAPPNGKGAISSGSDLVLFPGVSDPDPDPSFGGDLGSEPPRKRGPAKVYSEAFEACWREYGRKEEKCAAFEAWKIAAREFGGEGNLRVLVLGALKWQAPIWAADGWQFAKYFERYLKRKRWEDEPGAERRRPAGNPKTAGNLDVLRDYSFGTGAK